MAGSLILVSNPGSSSRKYALFDENLAERAQLHFEFVAGRVVCNLKRNNQPQGVDIRSEELSAVSSEIVEIFKREGVLSEDETIKRIGLRIVAPSPFFIQDHKLDDEVLQKVKETEKFAPLHISGTLGEIEALRAQFPDTEIILVSDSAFHRTKPSFTWNYGINLQDADRFGIKRYGYHGLSVESSINALWSSGKLPPKTVVCHLGSGSSITALFHGRSIDTTMGFSPLEGVVMATRSGSIDYTAARMLKESLGIDDDEFEKYLNKSSGLLGLTGSDDIRELINREANGDHIAHLALDTLVHSYHKAIGQMIATLNGIDLLVFTGTVGERSNILRRRIVANLQFADFEIDTDINESLTSPEKLTFINSPGRSKPIAVVPTNESLEIAKHVNKYATT